MHVAAFAYHLCHLPGDSRKIEKIMRLKTAAITSKAINMPRQLRRSGEMATSSWKTSIKITVKIPVQRVVASVVLMMQIKGFESDDKNSFYSNTIDE